MTAVPVPHPVIPVISEHGARQHQTPSPTLVVEIGEQNPFNFLRDSGWFTEIELREGELQEEVVGSYLYRVHLYPWLECNDYRRPLPDSKAYI